MQKPYGNELKVFLQIQSTFGKIRFFCNKNQKIFVKSNSFDGEFLKFLEIIHSNLVFRTFDGETL